MIILRKLLPLIAVALYAALPVVASAACSSEPTCGMHPHDWCCPPPGDPCGKHPDTGSCMQDSKCVGIKYRGESVESCIYNPAGFAVNCPTVGCMGREVDVGPGQQGYNPYATPTPAPKK